MVIWLDSNSNLCEKNVFINGKFCCFIFLDMERSSKNTLAHHRLYAVPVSQPEGRRHLSIPLRVWGDFMWSELMKIFWRRNFEFLNF
jgi:hypothetical protein